MSADLLALLEQTRPDLSPAERLALIEATPDRSGAKAPQKPAGRRVGSRPRHRYLHGVTPLLGCLWANAADKLQALIETMVELIEESGGSVGHA